MLNTALMQLEHCALTKLSLSFKESLVEPGLAGKHDLEEADSEGYQEVKFGVRTHKSEPRFWISYEVNVTWQPEVASRFDHVNVAVDGIFAFPAGTEEETVRHYVPLLCLTNLHGVARGVVAQSTGMCPGGPFILPLVDMAEVLKEYSLDLEASGSETEAEQEPHDAPCVP